MVFSFIHYDWKENGGIEVVDPKLVGLAIKKYRKRKGLTQEVLSGLAGLDRTHYSKIERGLRSPSLDSIFKIAIALNIQPHELIIEIEKMTLEPYNVPLKKTQQ